MYDINSISRIDQKPGHFESILNLYKIWVSRISKEDLVKTRDEIEIKIAEIIDERINPIGVESKRKTSNK